MNRVLLIHACFVACAVLPMCPSSAAGTDDSTSSARLVNDHCPVMPDEFASPQHEIQFHGSAVRFCCDECKVKFLSEPAAYVGHLSHLPAETVQAVIAQSQRQTRTEQADRWVDRWSRPALLGVALLIAVGIAGRAVVRSRRTQPPASP